MKLKAKLISMISAFCLVCVMLVVGIYALKSANFQMGGEISFKATGVNATISKGELATGSHVNSSDATTKMQGFSITTAEDQDEINALASSWSGLKLQFNAVGDDATITFTIKNDNTASDQYLGVAITVNQGTVDNASVSVSPATAVIEPEQTQEFVVTFSVTQKDMDASLKGFTLDFSLSHETPTSLLEYSTSEEGATITGISLKTIKNLTIPETVVIGGTVYPVVGIGDYALENCINIESIVIPDSITSIGWEPLKGCSSLKTIEIGKGVTLLPYGETHFSFIENLESITLHAENVVTAYTDMDFYNGMLQYTIYVPAGLVDAYKATDPWSLIAENIKPIPETREELNVTFTGTYEPGGDENYPEDYIRVNAPTAYKGEDFTFTIDYYIEVTEGSPLQWVAHVNVNGYEVESFGYAYNTEITIPASYMTQDLVIILEWQA